MSRSSRQKDKYGNSKELSKDDFNEGTAARTRPFSFEEIMLRRKQKKLADYAKEGAGEPAKSPEKGNGEGVAEEASHWKKKGFTLGAMKSVSNDSLKEVTRKKEEIIAKKEVAKVKESHEAKDNPKVKSGKHKSIRDKEEKNEKRSHHRSRTDERLKSDFENEPGKKHAKDTVSKYGERDKNSHGQSKRKHHSGNDEKNRTETDGSAPKKHDSGKWQITEHSERKGRKKESAQPFHEEVRPKRRRSRSREYVRDRDRRSISMSPRAHKHVSYHGREHEESTQFSFRERLGRHEKNRTSSNGGHGSGHYRRHGGSSGLGGYSPRKRRSEAAIRTPSPTVRSPERKSAAWDLPPTGTETVDAGSFLTSFQSVHPVAVLNTKELPPSVPATPSTLKPPPVASPNTISTTKETIDSIQLTQATRPMRRLYVENLPSSATDKAIVECFNNFLLSSGVNHIQGTQPCISCIINKEKGQALVEFLTLEDAASALSFDGRSFSGSILKIRRPKDFVEAPTRIPEKPATTVTTISDVVNDSQHKIFVGGISKALSSDMLKETVSAFGLLKAYRFEVNEEFDEPFAFLEYVDQSVTLKACSGLNGMKLGGNVLTAVQAIPDASGEETTEKPPFYGVPDHALPLLEKPTQVLKIKNVFNQEEFPLLSESELEEILEDVRLECARFGTVKSLNIIKYERNDVAAPEAIADTKNSNGIMEDAFEDLGRDAEIIPSPKERHSDDSTDSEVKPLNDVEKNASPKEQYNDGGKVKGPNDVGAAQDTKEVAEDVKESDKPVHDVEESKPTEYIHPDSNMAPAEPLELDTSEDQVSCLDKSAQSEDLDMEKSLISEDSTLKEVDGQSQKDNIESEEPVGEKSCVGNDVSEEACNLEIFEEGSIFIEYVRKEAACDAAHCLHRRPYGDHIVVVRYVPYDLYRARFP